nr:hypothetical protein [Tanacetum cinerariifolium]GEZ81758.1 hypothetical protein [Tanacetum cinerariifolium]
MIDWLSIFETDKVIHTVDSDIVKLVVEIESFGMSSDEFDKEIGSSDGLKPKQVDLSCVHALNELHLHEIRVVLTVKISSRNHVVFPLLADRGLPRWPLVFCKVGLRLEMDGFVYRSRSRGGKDG